MSGALGALRAAMESGDVQALGPAYARNAVLDAGLPGGRVRHLGRAAIVDELGRWWDGPASIGEWSARSWPAGAALTTERAAVRRRHYLHLSGDLIARHWVYAMAPRPRSDADARVPAEVLAALGEGARREAGVLLDWDIATQGTPAVELAWYLCHDAWRIDATHDEIVADFLAAEDGAAGPEALDLGLISGLVQYGWIFGHSALVHPDPAERDWAREELAWWVPRVRDALERSWSPA
jgi:hypothetical protein